MSKHGWNSLSNYVEVHNSKMQSLINQGFVLEDNCTITPLAAIASVVIEGQILCLGGIVVTVKKELDIKGDLGPKAKVRHRRFSYNANIASGRNILRYDSPVPHRDFYHKHIFDPFGNRLEKIVEIGPIAKVPTLGEVLDELQEWYWANREEIARWARRVEE